VADIVALNVHVVRREQTPVLLKGNVIGKILANGSGSGSTTPGWLCKVTKEESDCPAGSRSADMVRL
jgi:hypothetical protein